MPRTDVLSPAPSGRPCAPAGSSPSSRSCAPDAPSSARSSGDHGMVIGSAQMVSGASRGIARSASFQAIFACSSQKIGTSTPSRRPARWRKGPAAMTARSVPMHAPAARPGDVHAAHAAAGRVDRLDAARDELDPVLARPLEEVHAELLPAEPAAAARVQTASVSAVRYGKWRRISDGSVITSAPVSGESNPSAAAGT